MAAPVIPNPQVPAPKSGKDFKGQLEVIALILLFIAIGEYLAIFSTLI
jgi:hypothetical protein